MSLPPISWSQIRQPSSARLVHQIDVSLRTDAWSSRQIPVIFARNPQTLVFLDVGILERARHRHFIFGEMFAGGSLGNSSVPGSPMRIVAPRFVKRKEPNQITASARSRS